MGKEHTRRWGERKHWLDGWRTHWMFISFEHQLVHEERFWGELPTQCHRCIIERTVL